MCPNSFPLSTFTSNSSPKSIPSKTFLTSCDSAANFLIMWTKCFLLPLLVDPPPTLAIIGRRVSTKSPLFITLFAKKGCLSINFPRNPTVTRSQKISCLDSTPSPLMKSIIHFVIFSGLATLSSIVAKSLVLYSLLLLPISKKSLKSWFTTTQEGILLSHRDTILFMLNLNSSPRHKSANSCESKSDTIMFFSHTLPPLNSSGRTSRIGITDLFKTLSISGFSPKWLTNLDTHAGDLIGYALHAM
mmetsp:Transcript_5450/g.10907  ORF Transcript_5450/g.10907 Transcript_5450/m.10907 type:complete len:245 (-) Transcript_5450:697-1431(-)